MFEVCDGAFFHALTISILQMAVKEYVMESVFSMKLWRSLFLVKLQGLPRKWKSPLRSLWRSMLLASGCESLFVETFQEFTINGSEEVCDRLFF